MSSRHKSTRRGAQYPSPWSEGVWSEESLRYYRSRQRGPEEWDYEWEVPEVQANPNTPRTTSEEDTLGLAPESYPQQKNYTTETVAKGDVDTLIHGLTQTSISDPTTTYTTSTQSYSAQSPYSDQYSSSEPSGGPFSIAVPYNAQSSSPQILPSYASETPYASAPANNAQSHAPQSINWQHHIRTRNPDTDREEFDPSPWRLGIQIWKIVKVLWAGPSNNKDGKGSSGGSSGTPSLTVRKGADGKHTFACVRRFVVVGPLENHCICLPILTYSGRGVLNRGVHAENHAIIYSGRLPIAFECEKENGLHRRSIRVTPDNPRHKLGDASRLNYAKTYSIEYNVKVWFIGKNTSRLRMANQDRL